MDLLADLFTEDTVVHTFGDTDLDAMGRKRSVRYWIEPMMAKILHQTFVQLNRIIGRVSHSSVSLVDGGLIMDEAPFEMPFRVCRGWKNQNLFYSCRQNRTALSLSQICTFELSQVFLTRHNKSRQLLLSDASEAIPSSSSSLCNTEWAPLSTRVKLVLH